MINILICLIKKKTIKSMVISLVYSFSRITVTNIHNLDGLKQHKFILSQLKRPESEIKVSGRSHSLHCISGKILLASQLQMALPSPAMCRCNSSLCPRLLWASSSLFLIRTPVIGYKALSKPRMISIQVPYFISKTLFPNKVTF